MAGFGVAVSEVGVVVLYARQRMVVGVVEMFSVGGSCLFNVCFRLVYVVE